MPGFIQSIKSHLPQSPFSPTKNSMASLIPPEVAPPAGEGIISEEQPPSNVLPGQALVLPPPPTAALTLTAAHGESVQQPNSGDAVATQLVEQPDLPAQVELVSVENGDSSKPEESQDEAIQPEAPHVIAEEDTPAATIIQAEGSDAANCVSPASQPPSASENDVEPPVPENIGEKQVQTEVMQDTVSPSGDVTSIAAVNQASNLSLTPPEAVVAPPAAKTDKASLVCQIRRSKSKKAKTDMSPLSEASDVAGPSCSKPRKSNPFAGKFKNVIDQVRSKVKKDKETAITPPVVMVIEPTLNRDETAIAA